MTEDNSIGQRIARLLGASAAPPKIDPGVHHFEDLTGDVVTRFHLRVDPDHGGLLMANAAEAAHLSKVGVLMAHGLLSGKSHDVIRSEVKAAFRDASDKTIEADLQQVEEVIDDLASPDDNYPVSNYADPEMSGWSRVLLAPMQADIDQCDPEQAEGMLRILWEIGVPHVTWVVDPRRDVQQLPRLVEVAEDIGMVCGLRTAAGWIADDTVAATAAAGLDHIDVMYIANEPPAHDAIAGDGDRERVTEVLQECREMEFACVAVVPVFRVNVDDLADIIFGARQEGMRNMSFFALACPDEDGTCGDTGALKARELHQVAATIEDASLEMEGRYLWLPPVRRDPSLAVQQQVLAGPRTSGDLCIRVNRDGDVYPPRGPRRSAGNLLADDWKSIWDDDGFARYRERLARPQECPDCRDLPICVADCPGDPGGWSEPGEVGENA